MIDINIEKLAIYYESGITLKTLSEVYNCSEAIIRSKLKKHYTNQEQKMPKPKGNIEEIIKKFESGITRESLAEEYNVSYNSICIRIRNYYKKRYEKCQYSKRKEIIDIVKYHNEGLTDTQIAKIYGCSKQNINEKLKRYYKEMGKEKEDRRVKFKMTIKDIKNKKYNTYTVEEVAQKFGMSCDIVREKINKLCKNANINRKDYIKTEYEKNLYDGGKKIFDLYIFGYTQTEIAEKYGTTQGNIRQRLDTFYKANNIEKPNFLTKKEIDTFVKRGNGIKEIEIEARNRGKEVPTRKIIEALKEFRQDLYLYYLDKENRNRYKLENNIEAEMKKIRNKSLIKLPKSF